MSKDNVTNLAERRKDVRAADRDDMGAAFKALSADMGNDMLLTLMLPQFILDLEAGLRKIDRALVTSDFELIRHHAGILKQSAADMQLPYFSDMLEKLEYSAGNRQMPSRDFTRHFSLASEYIFSEMISRLQA